MPLDNGICPHSKYINILLVLQFDAPSCASGSASTAPTQLCLWCAGDALITAPWPHASGPVDAHAVQQFGALQSVVRSIRNARAEYSVELGRKIPATICVAADDTRFVIASLTGGSLCPYS